MKKKILFFAKAALMLGLVVGFLFGLVMPQYAMSYNASLLDKVKRLKSIDGPKIVLIGNSNLAFGIDSAAIEEAFGMPVVNMGVHGGLGNAFHEEMAKINVHEGDIYIVCQTEYDDDDTILDPSLCWITLENHLSLWTLLRQKDVPQMAEAFSTYVKKALEQWTEGTGNRATDPQYAREAFNEYGDNRYPRLNDGSVPPPPYASQEVPRVGDACVDRLNALAAYLESRGATLLLAAFPIASGEYTPLVEEYEAFQEELESRLNFPVISYFTDYLMEYGYFYDTLFHLTDAGVEIRTNLLIEDLSWWMENRER